MNQPMGLTTIAVSTRHPTMDLLSTQSRWNALDIPPRSRLYGLVPCEVGTIWAECLTSYINRLGWVHRVAPGELVAQELVPQLSNGQPTYQLTAFCRYRAMGLNGNGEPARKWATLVAQLTGHADLSLLTLHRWIGNLASSGHLRRMPAWCPACYSAWREQGVPIYQPLLWQYQVVSICPQHHQPLETRCPHCRKAQSMIATNRFPPGACTQCGAWLGASAGAQADQASEEELAWQHWVLSVLEGLRMASAATSPLHWEPFFAGLATCLQEPKAPFRLGRLTGINSNLFARWPSGADESYAYTPSLKTILRFCYACDVTPLQIMSHELTSLRDIVQKRTAARPARPRRPAPNRIDRQKCLEQMQALLDGRAEPISLRQLAKRLGYGERVLAYNFPQECALIIKRAQEYRKLQQEQRLSQICTQVRQTVLALHTQGIYPSRSKVGSLLPAGWMRRPAAEATRREVVGELGQALRPLNIQPVPH